MPNLKFVSLAISKLLAFNALKFMGHVTLTSDHAHFSKTFVRGHVETIPGSTLAKFKVRFFSHFGAISI